MYKPLSIRIPAVLLSAGLMVVNLVGCTGLPRLYEPNPRPAPRMAVAREAKVTWEAPRRTDGSLWSSDAVQWFGDDKARRPGDIVLVRVVQKNAGSKNANTDTERTSSISATIKGWLGLEDEVNKLTKGTEGTGERGTGAFSPIPLVDAEGTSTFEGAGQTARTDNLEATVSAVVTDVLPNGNLAIYGHQTVTLNNEASMLTVQGIVRPSDIGPTNTVDSQRIANADIQFTGSGVITDKQHPGWAVRALDWVWPF